MKFEISSSNYYLNSTEMESMYADYLSNLSVYILDSVESILNTLSYKDFIQESRDYLKGIGQPTTGANVLICAADILDSFKRDFRSLVYVDVESKCLIVSESLFDLEYGSAYKPAARVIVSAVDRLVASMGTE